MYQRGNNILKSDGHNIIITNLSTYSFLIKILVSIQRIISPSFLCIGCPKKRNRQFLAQFDFIRSQQVVSYRYRVDPGLDRRMTCQSQLYRQRLRHVHGPVYLLPVSGRWKKCLPGLPPGKIRHERPDTPGTARFTKKQRPRNHSRRNSTHLAAGRSGSTVHHHQRLHRRPAPRRKHPQPT